VVLDTGKGTPFSIADAYKVISPALILSLPLAKEIWTLKVLAKIKFHL